MKAKQVNKIINYGIGISAAYFIGSAIAGAIKRKRESTSGVGAAKRRIFKELSLAQKAGVDFTKKYDELTDKEITALQRVSNDTGYTETYYKSLKKAYDAISGIGAAYDVTDADGNTLLTWIEDPDGQTYARAYDPERDRAYLEEQEIEADRQWAAENKAREFEEREARLAEQRKRLRKAGRSSQMALFGVGNNTPTYSESRLNTYLDTYHIAELVAQNTPDGKVLCMVGDEIGGREFYLNRANFLYLFNYCLTRRVPIAYWAGDHWLTRNNGEELVSGTDYAPEVETELYEIWREQIEYGDTDYDYETWRKVVGDEYVRDVMRYM